jgi:predicted transcriptional regulator
MSTRISLRNLSNDKLRQKIINLECENTLLNNQLQKQSVLEQKIFTLEESNRSLRELNKNLVDHIKEHVHNRLSTHLKRKQLLTELMSYIFCGLVIAINEDTFEKFDISSFDTL